jgi:hypothetical protein
MLQLDWEVVLTGGSSRFFEDGGGPEFLRRLATGPTDARLISSVYSLSVSQRIIKRRSPGSSRSNSRQS